MKRIIKILKAAGDRNRLRILKLLQQRDGCCVCEIQDVIGVGQSTTSRHLRILEEADLIYSVREGKWINFYLNNRRKDREVRELLGLIEKWLEDDRQILIDESKLRKADRAVICGGE